MGLCCDGFRICVQRPRGIREFRRGIRERSKTVVKEIDSPASGGPALISEDEQDVCKVGRGVLPRFVFRE